MQNYRCPKCGERTISFWRKQFASAFTRIPCSNCGARLAIPWVRAAFIWMAAMCIPLYGAIVTYLAIPFVIPNARYSELGLYASFSLGFVLGSIAVIWS